jgi:hypothetical protein
MRSFHRNRAGNINVTYWFAGRKLDFRGPQRVINGPPFDSPLLRMAPSRYNQLFVIAPQEMRTQ